MVNLVRQDYKKNKQAFNNIKKDLIKLLGQEIKVEHVGSTAIPNMVGKNIIDILIEAPDLQILKMFGEQLGDNGFYPSSKNDVNSKYLFFASSERETEAGDIHIHLALKDSERYRDFISLKNYLIKHPDVAKDYSETKKLIVQDYGHEREEYKKIKSKYVSDLINIAREEFNATTPQ